MSEGKPIEEMSFEDAIRELQGVVEALDNGEVPLAESIDLYDLGAKLKARCEKTLREAEEKISQITLDANGQPTGTTPVEGL